MSMITTNGSELNLNWHLKIRTIVRSTYINFQGYLRNIFSGSPLVLPHKILYLALVTYAIQGRHLTYQTRNFKKLFSKNDTSELFRSEMSRFAPNPSVSLSDGRAKTSPEHQSPAEFFCLIFKTQFNSFILEKLLSLVGRRGRRYAIRLNQPEFIGFLLFDALPPSWFCSPP